MFSALADPVRREILVLVGRQDEVTVSDILGPFAISEPAISRHLKVLEDAELIDRRREGRHHFIKAKTVGIGPAQQWMQQWVMGWSFSLDRLGELIEEETEG